MLTFSIPTVVFIIVIFFYRRLLKSSAQVMEIELDKELMVNTELHNNSVRQRLIELREEEKELSLDQIDLDKEMAEFKKKYRIR